MVLVILGGGVTSNAVTTETGSYGKRAYVFYMEFGSILLLPPLVAWHLFFARPPSAAG